VHSDRTIKDTLQAAALLTLPAISILLVLAEALLRFGGYTPYYLDSEAFIASRNPQIIYELKPGFRGLYAGVPISINAMGVRGNGG
jgi:hypothetical protein